MELFRNTNFDFLGKKWPFIIASLVLTVAGLISLAVKGGPRWGIDFQGGTLMTYKFAGPPPVSQIRSVLDKALPSAPTVQDFIGGQNQVSIGTAGEDNAALTRNRQIVLDTLEKNFAHAKPGKVDFNNTTEQAVKDRLRDPLTKNGVMLSEPQLTQLVARYPDFLEDAAALRRADGFRAAFRRERRDAGGGEDAAAELLSRSVQLAEHGFCRVRR